MKWVPLCNTDSLQVILHVFYSRCSSVTPTAYVVGELTRIKGILSSALILNFVFRRIYRICFSKTISISHHVVHTSYSVSIFLFVFWVMCKSSILAVSRVKLDRYWAERNSRVPCLPTYQLLSKSVAFFVRCKACRTGRDRSYLHILSPRYNRAKT